MRTARLLPYLPAYTSPGRVHLLVGCTCWWVYLPGVYLPGVYLPGGVPDQWGVRAQGVYVLGVYLPSSCNTFCCYLLFSFWQVGNISMLNEDVRDFIALVEGYYRLYVNPHRSLLREVQLTQNNNTDPTGRYPLWEKQSYKLNLTNSKRRRHKCSMSFQSLS